MNIKQYLGFKCVGCGKWSGKELFNIRGSTREALIKRLQRLHCKCYYCNKGFQFYDKVKGDSRCEHYWFDSFLPLNELIKQKNSKR